MSEKTKRKFWQFHLSTAMLLSIAVGGLLYVNTKYKVGHFRMIVEPLLSDDGSQMGISHMSCLMVEYGWPDVALEMASDKRYWNMSAVAVNLLTAAAILGFIAFLSEWVIRRREARKT